ncbi:DUF3149 domain-containing protein [Pseudidiomarina taiwanensis]|uniref:DUF3149 domain-containing protein n=1 Tax=Pseudidiomarina taiwanensis TaxID=337250 RepID=A0A432ZMM0_9GAMM|nr:DUF3149 domain-containing protein [Pseudidiomarina taiwanensis]RUO79127.1 DUF3149 domain-containing protein [Pseudidiomarina taiwanensis]
MELFKEFFTDPVLFFSFTGLAVLLGICIFYVIYFIRNTVNEQPREPKSSTPKPSH